jgi:hypothetical protein
MRLIDALTSDANQSATLVLDDGTKVGFSIAYKETQQGWFYSITYGTVFNIKNRRLVNCPNVLRAFREVLPFGLACMITDGLEPVYIDDFVTGRAKLYLLSQDDIATAETVIAEFVDA